MARAPLGAHWRPRLVALLLVLACCTLPASAPLVRAAPLAASGDNSRVPPWFGQRNFTLSPGQQHYSVIEFQNTGTTTWEGRFFGSYRLLEHSSQQAYTLAAPVPPDRSAFWGYTWTAPSQPGDYWVAFQMADLTFVTTDSRGPFGETLILTFHVVGAAASTPTATPALTASPAPTTAPPATPGAAATATPTRTATPPPTCAPRPAVGLVVAPTGSGELRVTVTAQTNASTPRNTLHSIQIGSASNAVIVVDNPVGTENFSLALAPGTTQAVFLVRRAVAGQATTVPLVVVDDCGEWRTLVGGGTSAF